MMYNVYIYAEFHAIVLFFSERRSLSTNVLAVIRHLNSPTNFSRNRRSN